MYARVLIVLLCGAAFALGLLGYGRMTAENGSGADARLGEVWFNDLAGKPQHFSQWSGKVLVVNFWATWCPPCKEEMPEFTRVQAEWAQRGVQFVGIAVDEAQEVQSYLAANPVNYPILIGEPGGPEWAAELGDALQVLPFTAIIGRDGKVVRVKSGPYLREELIEVLSRVAGDNGAAPAR